MNFKHCFILSFILFLIVFSCKKDKPFNLPDDITSDAHGPVHLDGGAGQKSVYKNLDELPDLKGKLLVELQAVQSDISVYEGLLNGPVIETDNPSTGGKFYMIYWEAFGGSLFKLLVKTDLNGDPIKANVFELDFDEGFLQSYYARETDIPHIEGSVNVMTIHRFFEKRNGDDSGGVDPCIKDCMTIVFGNPDPPSGGGGSSNGPSEGNSSSIPELPEGCHVEISAVVCGCSPHHIGGYSSPDCVCGYPDIYFWSLVCELTDEVIEDRGAEGIWDCVDILNNFGLITDHDLYLMRLEECGGYLESYDYGPDNPSGTHPDLEFCEDWMTYQNNCIAPLEWKDSKDAWAELMWKNPQAFHCLMSNDDGCTGDDLVGNHTEYINAVTELSCLNEKQQCDLIIGSSPNGILLMEELQPEIQFEDDQLCWLIDHPEVVDGVENYLNDHPFPNDEAAKEEMRAYVTDISGQDWIYDEEYWSDPDLTFPAQQLPSYQDFHDGFPKDPDGRWMWGADDVYELAGGDVLQVREDDLAEALANNQNPRTDNTCALKVSIALNEAGVDIPCIQGQTIAGADGKCCFLNARMLADWMKLTFPNDFESWEDVNSPDVHSNINGRKGIVISVFPEGSGSSGHADIYLGSGCSVSYNTNYCGFGGDVYFWPLN